MLFSELNAEQIIFTYLQEKNADSALRAFVVSDHCGRVSGRNTPALIQSVSKLTGLFKRDTYIYNIYICIQNAG